MLVLKDIVKEYPTGEDSVVALRGINMCFRANEFVSILGQSGCGKTTLLNIIGGLDQYTSGDLIINGKSTKEFKDRDWDTYRNHSIGFVFQSYNLIPHQTVLSNVELALTLSGVSKSERKRRAKEALEKVGLADQLYKKPNQMSGGQMQRVAIARALVNNPEILLADEPTGALDSTTSVQIMELLKEIAKDRLVIMVTHNPNLAETYSTRIIRVLDGKVTDDSNPCLEDEIKTEGAVLTKEEKKERRKQQKKSAMSFFTALSLSLNNLMTKKTRTFLTSFAGSIGIIGIALILAVSNGVQNYIDRVQEDTLSSYPITIEAESMDMSSIITSLMGIHDDENRKHGLDKVYPSTIMYELMNALNSADTVKNNLTPFKTFMEKDEEAQKAISALQYSYDLDMNIFTKDEDGTILKSDVMPLLNKVMGLDADSTEEETESTENSSSIQDFTSTMMQTYTENNPMMSRMEVWEEILPGMDEELVNGILDEQYDMLYGHWPQAYNEIVLLVNERNEISDVALYALGLKTEKEMLDNTTAQMRGEEIEITDESWTYEEICDKEFKLVLGADYYQKQADGSYTDLSRTEAGRDFLYHSDTAIDLKIVGIIRPNEDAIASMMTGTIGYTKALTDYIIETTHSKEIVKEQLADKETDVITGLPFPKDEEEELPNAEKAARIQEYFATLNTLEKAEMYAKVKVVPSESYLKEAVAQALAGMSEEEQTNMLIQGLSSQMGISEDQVSDYVTGMDAETRSQYVNQMMMVMVAQQYAEGVSAQLGQLSTDTMAAMFDQETFTEEQYVQYYDLFMPKQISDSTYEDNLKRLGYVDEESPKTMNIYATTFEAKERIEEIIDEYNEGKEEEDQIKYTDYVMLMMSSVSTIINAISYVLIAFVAISLVVSSIMIGIITYISVLERTKEIGILRAIGASKKDISRVFNAETLIVGFVAGALGIGITLLLNVIINIILHKVTGIEILNASVPPVAGVVLVLISMFLTLIAGLVPSRLAAKKDPVVALRTE